MSWEYKLLKVLQFVVMLVYWALSPHERKREGTGLFPRGWREP